MERQMKLIKPIKKCDIKQTIDTFGLR